MGRNHDFSNTEKQVFPFFILPQALHVEIIRLVTFVSGDPESCSAELDGRGAQRYLFLMGYCIL